jgi:Flp pilus assembly protein TadG
MGGWVYSIKKFFQDESGAILPTAALVGPVVLAMAAFGVDGSYYLMTKSNLQTAADAAALAAAWEISQESPEYADSSALREAQDNGFDPEAGTLELDLNETVDGEVYVTATISQDAPLWLSSIILTDPVKIGVSAESLVSNDYVGNYCILALDEEADGALTTSGSVTLNAQTCGVAVNSSSDEAIDINGNVDLNFGTVTISGDYNVSGGSADFSYESLHTHASRTRDPYADLEVPETTACSASAIKRGTSISGSGTAYLNPGVYCGGLTISGTNDIIFNPGVYVFDAGGLTVTGGGTLTAEGVTFIFTNTGAGNWGKIKISGNKVVNIQATQEGYYAGVAMFVDREAPDDGTTHSITGTADVLIDGVVYVPTQNLVFGGTSVAGTEFEGCTKLIAQTVGLHGNPLLGTSCEGSPVRSIGNRLVKLVN